MKQTLKKVVLFEPIIIVSEATQSRGRTNCHSASRLAMTINQISSKFIFALLIFVSSSLAIGSNPCSVIDGDDARAYLSVDNGILCFKLQPALSHDGDILQDEGMWTYVYSIQPERQVVKVGNLERGKIEDAFDLDVNKDGKKEVVVIHSEEIRTYTGSCMTSPWYAIFVFKQTETGFEYDKRASRWFGSGADLVRVIDRDLCDDGKLIYVYPYKTKDAIEETLSSSPFVSLIERDMSLPATLVRKSWLYESSTVATKTKKYLIANDKVTVNEFSANLCLITYSTGKKPLQMWLKCDALKLDSEKFR